MTAIDQPRGTALCATYAAVAAIVCLVALIACLVPLWRALSVDPVRALRAE